ncbi:hypothetical protein [Clostridium rectalis]|uniref:hypothetical protein n=1 Tax=Clostridium rectalis TaxID=2040295 RepID=UPI000F63DDB5|nr:hypothetical protein [Clostridium rectalis]
MNKKLKYKNGFALPIAMLCGIIVVSLGGILLTSLNNQIKTEKTLKENMIAKYLSEAGIEHAIYDYNLEKKKDYKLVPDKKESEEIKFNGGEYKFGYYKKNEEEGVFESVGKSSGGNKYKIEATFNIRSNKIVDWQESNNI